MILGITGQDAALLAHLLLAKGYRVHGVSRTRPTGPLPNLQRLGVNEQVEQHVADTTDSAQTLRLLDAVAPDEIYDLAGQTSVGLSFERPAETFRSIAVRASTLLDCLRTSGSRARLFLASSTECFGETPVPADETTPLRPNSPYAAAKAAAFWTAATYRESYGLYVASGLLANHESPFRPERFVTRKIVRAAVRIGQGAQERLCLGFIGIRRDWGWAAEHVEAMWRTLQADLPADYVVATGHTVALEAFVAAAFAEFGLDWHDYVDVDPSLFRPTETMNAEFDPTRARDRLGWQARSRMEDVVRYLTRSELDGSVGPLPWVPDSYDTAAR